MTTTELAIAMDEAPYEPTNEEYARPGHTIWHSSDEDSGPDVGISLGLGNGKHLWCGEITKDAWAAAPEEVRALGDDSGSWLIVYDAAGSRQVIGRVDHYEGRALIELLAAALTASHARGLEEAARCADGWTEVAKVAVHCGHCNDGLRAGREIAAAIRAGNAPAQTGPKRETLAPGREHLTVSGTFQSDKYPWCPAGFVPLKVTDPMARGPLLAYADERELVDKEFARDLRDALDTPSDTRKDT